MQSLNSSALPGLARDSGASLCSNELDTRGWESSNFYIQSLGQ